MLRTFNCGVGFCLILNKKQASKIKNILLRSLCLIKLALFQKIRKVNFFQLYKMVKKNTCVFISGYGSNLRHLIQSSRVNNFPIRISLVISNNKNARGLLYAKMNSIPYLIINTKKRNFENKILNELKKHKISFICLAGYMKIISKKFLQLFTKTIINIHPFCFQNSKD